MAMEVVVVSSGCDPLSPEVEYHRISPTHELTRKKERSPRMPTVREMFPSRFLCKEDVGEGLILTIRDIRQIDVAGESEQPEFRWAIDFVESERPMILNHTNAIAIKGIFHSADTSKWIGRQIELYEDPTVTIQVPIGGVFRQVIVGGIRIRPARRGRKRS